MAALSPPSISHQRRTPEDTGLYRVVPEHLDTFLAHAQSAEGAGRLPDFVTREVEESLKGGLWAHGLARLRCSGGGDDSLIAFR
jgi:hypothetical protein